MVIYVDNQIQISAHVNQPLIDTFEDDVAARERNGSALWIHFESEKLKNKNYIKISDGRYPKVLKISLRGLIELNANKVFLVREPKSGTCKWGCRVVRSGQPEIIWTSDSNIAVCGGDQNFTGLNISYE
jgi:hypothetical protein